MGHDSPSFLLCSLTFVRICPPQSRCVHCQSKAEDHRFLLSWNRRARQISSLQFEASSLLSLRLAVGFSFMQNAPRAAEGKFALVLVHGTWGRGFFPKISPSSKMRRWFEKNSAFYSQIIRTIGSRPFSIEAFSWSGSNSILARKRASLDLARLIDERIEAGVTNIIAIGHSHGGNVIVDAIPFTKHKCCRLTIITLATPFLSFADKVQSASEASLYYIGYFVSISLACGLLHLFDFEYGVAAAVLAFWALYYRAEQTIASELLMEGYGKKGIAEAIVAIMFLPKHFLDEVFSMSEIRFKRPPNSLDFRTIPIYALRSPYDEASLALGISAFISKWAEFLPRIVWTAGLLSSAFLLGFLMLALSIGVVGPLNSFQGSVFDYFVLSIGFVIFLIMFVAESMVLRGLSEQIGLKRPNAPELPPATAPQSPS